MEGYDFTREQLPALLDLGVLPEQPKPESAVLIEFLRAHLNDYDRFSVSVRLGPGQTPNPEHEPGVQYSSEFSSKKRLDLLAYSGTTPTIVEAKIRISADLLGKLFLYRHLYLEEFPDSVEPRLVGVGRFVDPVVERAIVAHGVTLYVYDT